MGKFNQTSTGYKCFAKDSKVNTDNGLKNIQDVQIGDQVYNCYNELDTVVNTFEYEYEDSINKIVLENGKEIKAIDGHYLLIQRDGELYWESIELIKETDLLVELEEDDNIDELRKTIPVYDVRKY